MIVYILLFGTGFYYARSEVRVPQIVAYEYKVLENLRSNQI